MAPRDLDKLLQKYLAGNCSEEERDLIDAWYASLGTTSADPEESVNEKMLPAEGRILHALREHASVSTDGPEDSVPGRPMFWQYVGIAASLLIVLIAGYYFFRPVDRPGPVADTAKASEYAVISNSAGTSRRVILPDGSIVLMSPESIVRFPHNTDGTSREIFLEGEAYFDVAHNPAKPFYVYAGNVITKVLGTSFIIRNRKDESVTVSVKTGKVTVYSRKTSHRKTVLTPNQEAVYDQEADFLATQPVTASALDEKRNLTEMNFEETPVSEVLTLLMKTYDINISFQAEALSGCVLTSSFYEEGLYDRIDVICTAIGATYRIVDAQIIIESKGCNLKSE
jgi:ferric-dicitrate binding protein FerR (iron transport regulator)